MSEWQTIESAPKDGTKILLSHKWFRDKPFIGYWANEEWIVDKCCVEVYGDGDIVDDIGLQKYIDLWMPIPPPPGQQS